MTSSVLAPPIALPSHYGLCALRFPQSESRAIVQQIKTTDGREALLKLVEELGDKFIGIHVNVCLDR